ncbi:MAG: GSCFA domain-containing protein [Chitinophagaceae bacterium]
MEFMTPISISSPEQKLRLQEPLLLLGSCFTEHIGQALNETGFQTLQNPNGILFDPASVAKSLISYVENRQYGPSDLFQWQEVWHSWDHHSRFSDTDQQKALSRINQSQQQAHDFLKKAEWIIITLGSSYSYRLTAEAANASAVCDNRLLHPYQHSPGVANCHRAPGSWFRKHLLDIEETVSLLDNCYHQLLRFNPRLKIIFTISPVRHIRDGVVANNRSKARLIESVHHLAEKFDRIYYFPAYELVIDVLRDYRFFDVDMAHPNFAATEFVWEKFENSFINPDDWPLMQDIKKLRIARRHRAQHPNTVAHRNFLNTHFEKAQALQSQYPFLNLQDELVYFGQQAENR